MKRYLIVPAAIVASGGVLAGVVLAASSPAVVTGTHSHVTTNSAVLHGTVNPNGRSTVYLFQWGLTTAYGVNSRLRSAGHGTTPVPVQATATGLIPGTVYHYHLIAASRFGSAVGADRTFRTAGHPPPGVATGPVTQIGPFGATVTGIVNPNGETTSWTFQYGTTAAYGVETFGGSVGPSRSPVAVSALLQGLQPFTTFHYRLVALHAGSIASLGADNTFTTLPFPAPVPRVRFSTRPRRARSKPFVFTTVGRVIRPSSIPASLACFGSAAIHFLMGTHVVADDLVPVQPNCTFSGVTVFNRLPGHGRRHGPVRLRVLVHFRGNGYLAPANGRAKTVRVG